MNSSKLTVAELQHILDTRDKGVLSHGKHKEDEGAYCALEAVSLARSLKCLPSDEWTFTDSPEEVGMPDLRAINDGPWTSNEARTKALLPLLAALSDWSEWGKERQKRWADRVTIRTVNLLIAELPYLPATIAKNCCTATTPARAAEAARAAGAAAGAAGAAAWAAEAAGAAWAAEAARAAGAAAGAAEAAWAAEAAGAAWAAEAARAAGAARAARAAALAAPSDHFLLFSASIALDVLRELKSPGVAWLDV
jgi:hypothetical protein